MVHHQRTVQVVRNTRCLQSMVNRVPVTHHRHRSILQRKLYQMFGNVSSLYQIFENMSNCNLLIPGHRHTVRAVPGTHLPRHLTHHHHLSTVQRLHPTHPRLRLKRRHELVDRLTHQPVPPTLLPHPKRIKIRIRIAVDRFGEDPNQINWSESKYK